MTEALFRISPDFRELKPLNGKMYVITGTSRGIGAETVKTLVTSGATVIGCSVDPRKEKRQKALKNELGVNSEKYVYEITDVSTEEGRDTLLDIALSQKDPVFKYPKHPISGLIISASGGMEADKPDNYAYTINTETPAALVDKFAPHMIRGGRVIFLTSLPAREFGSMSQDPRYEPIAKTKHEGELRLMSKMEEFEEKEITLGIVSAPFVRGTVMYAMYSRWDPNFVRKASETGGVVDKTEVAKAIRDMLMLPFPSGTVYNVGNSNPSTLNFGSV